MTDQRYWHRQTVNKLFQARSDLYKVRTEFDRVSTALNEAVAEANRWQDAYERLVAGRDAEGAQETVEARSEAAEYQRAQRDLVQTSEQLVAAKAERDQWRKLAHEAEDDAEWLNRKLTDTEADARVSLDRIERERDEAKSRAEKAETRAEAWEENHQILAEHYHRMTNRAKQAEHRANVAEADATDYLDRATCAEEDRDRMEAQARGWKQTAESYQHIARGHDCLDCNEVELDRYGTEKRCAAWWETAKTLCRQRNDARCDRKLLQHLVDDAELARDAADAEVRRLAGADERAGCNWHDMNRTWRRNRLALSVLAQRPYDHATAELAARVLDGTYTESEVNHATD